MTANLSCNDMPTRLLFHLPFSPMRHSFQGYGELFEHL